MPDNADPLDPRIEDAEERNRMVPHLRARPLPKPRALCFRCSAGTPPPARRLTCAGRARNGPFDAGKLFLVPGDSPVGYRLPLSSLPWVPPSAYPYTHPQDPLEERGPLPDARELAQRVEHFERSAEPATARQERIEQEAIEGAVRTALSVEPRDGVICVFMPPVEKLDDYLELLAAVEASAKATGAKIYIEGYPPPFDPRVEVIKVTPDPGVIEVNIQPAASWRAAVDTTKGLYEDARQVRLGADKFMLEWAPYRHRRGQSCRSRRRDAARFSLPAAARPVKKLGALLAAPPVAVLSVLGAVHWPDEPGAAHRRSPSRSAL